MQLTLTRGYVALIDDEDFPRVSAEGRWWADDLRPRTYAFRRNYRGPKIYLHRFVMNAGQGFDVDHINGNGLDCRKANLRLCTRSENLLNMNDSIRIDNKSGTRGVYWDNHFGVWKAEIKVRGRKFTLGSFASSENAAARRKLAEAAVINGLNPKTGEPL